MILMAAGAGLVARIGKRLVMNSCKVSASIRLYSNRATGLLREELNRSPGYDKVEKLFEFGLAPLSATTFDNRPEKFLGREPFQDKMKQYFEGNLSMEEFLRYSPADYHRVASILGAITEFKIAETVGADPRKTFVYASAHFPLIAMRMQGEINIQGKPSLAEDQMACLDDFCNAEQRNSSGTQEEPLKVLSLQSFEVNSIKDALSSDVDAVVVAEQKEDEPRLGILIGNNRVDAAKVQQISKRFCTPPDFWTNKALWENPAADNNNSIHEEHRLKLDETLWELSGEKTSQPAVVSNAGLPALNACVYGCLKQFGTIDMICASTAYGGSSESMNIMADRSQDMALHLYDIQGDRDVLYAINKLLESIKGNKKKGTVIKLEFPTNPDMKVCDLMALSKMLINFQKKSGSSVVLILDTTLCPSSKPLSNIANELACIVFNSLSKSGSAGKSTGGSLVANESASSLLKNAREVNALFGNEASHYQVEVFAEQSDSIEKRIHAAHENARWGAKLTGRLVKKITEKNMPINFVSDEEAIMGVCPATFSFNLPSSAFIRADGLAQEFVNALASTGDGTFKPCVSFGQGDLGKMSPVYATVPETSTQGSVDEKDKVKQRSDEGVSQVRFSFPPTMDRNKVQSNIQKALAKVYGFGSSI